MAAITLHNSQYATISGETTQPQVGVRYAKPQSIYTIESEEPQPLKMNRKARRKATKLGRK